MMQWQSAAGEIDLARGIENQPMRHLLQLLKNELWQASLPGDAFADADWEAIYAEARRQTVIALAANALERIPAGGHLPPLPLSARWLAEAESIRQTGRQMNSKLTALLAALADAGVTPTVLKGQTVATLYPDPLSRQCGDIDLFIPPEQQPAMTRFLAGSHMAAAIHSDGSQSFVWQGVEVEIHPRIFDIHSPFARRRIDRIIPLKMQFGRVETCLDRLAPEATLLLLSAHILKHALGRGIGLRQLCDLAVATSALHADLDPALTRRLFHDAGLRRWTSTVYSFLTLHLGFPTSRLPYPGIAISRRRADRLLRIIARSGNFSRPAGVIATALSFVRRSRFSLLTAPAEAFWTAAMLAKGRLTNPANR